MNNENSKSPEEEKGSISTMESIIGVIGSILLIIFLVGSCTGASLEYEPFKWVMIGLIAFLLYGFIRSRKW